MGAFVEHSFRRGFLLDEEKLRKLRDIIGKRLSKEPNDLAVTYKVSRGDSYSYTTTSIDDVGKEDNEDWRAITRLELLVDGNAQLEFRLSFDKSGTELKIIGEDRDFIFLLLSDVKDFVENEICVAVTFPRNFERALAMIVVMVAMFLMFGTLAYREWQESPDAIENALKSNDSLDKLNYLVERTRTQRMGMVVWAGPFLMLISVLLLSTSFLEVPIRKGFPSNEFLFGKRKQTFDRRRTLFGNVFWVVVVGLVVSIIGGIIVWWMTI